MPKEVIYNHSVAPWARSFQNDGIKRIDRVTYFGGILRVYLINNAWLASLKDFASSNLPRDVYSVESVTQKVQFLANGLQPNLNCEEKAEFEKLFKWTTSRSSGINVSQSTVSSQLVTMEHLECRLEEVCNKLLTVMQALFTEAITTFEIGNLGNLPDIISSSFQFPRDLKQKRLNSPDTNPRSAKKSNITSNVTRSDSDDSILELDETDSDFVTTIINAQTALINNGTAAFIPDAATRKL
ncbi:hypothetical protein ACOME3_001955 [Neoechinorhynchus agilis]